MHRRKLSAFAPLIAYVLLAACGQSKIDSRQVDFHDGLVYEHNHQDPYTGVISFAQPPDFLMQYIDSAGIRLSMKDYASAKDLWSCNVSFETGVRNGATVCKDQSGSSLLTLSYDHERPDGSSVVYDPETDKKLVDLNWKDGVLDGKQLYYAADGETVAKEVHYANGLMDGREIRRSPTGDVLADGTWNQGKPLSGKIQTKTDQGLTAVATFVDGALEGPATIYGYKDQVPATGSFKNGLRDGPWTDNGASSGQWTGEIYQNNPSFNSMFGIDGSLTEREIVPVFGRCAVIKSNWVNGALKGGLECTAGNGAIVLSMNMDGSRIIGNFLFHDVTTGTTTHLMQSDGKLVPVDQADATATSPTNNATIETATAQPAPAPAPAPASPPPSTSIALPAPSVPPPVVTTATMNAGNAGAASRTELARTYQPGFDCAMAQAPAETAICADPLLSALDSDVAAQYHALTQQDDSSQKSALLSSQREYLATRSVCGSDRACLERQTRSRLHDLRQQAARTPGVLITTLKSDHVSAP
jgi:antitoxin component YwqK of YwqJK toxin-antitoxin module/uncharacterized protein YecT (DUF1311 family)